MHTQVVRFALAFSFAAASTAAAAPQVIDPVGGNAYEFVSTPPLGWMDAEAAAASRTFMGVPGHLVTISSAAENDFVRALLPMPAFIGGFQDTSAADFSEPAGGWRWVTGEVFDFTSWGPAEPNNQPAPENLLELFPSGDWNDIGDGPGYDGLGYVVEYEIGACAQDDALSPNHSCLTPHTFAGPVSSATVIDVDLVVSNRDSDFFRIGADPSGSTIYARVDFLHSEGNIDLFLYPEFGCGPPTTAYRPGTQDFETVKTSTTAPQILEVRRRGGPGPCSAYRLSILQQRFDGGLGGAICANGTNSLSEQAELFVSGSAVVADNDLRLSVGQLPAQSFGFFLNSRGAGNVFPPGSQGFVCINFGGVGRFNRPGEILFSGPSPFGSVHLDVDLTDVPRPFNIAAIQPGERWAFQYWYRDLTSGGAPTSNFSTAQMVWFE